MEEEEKLKLLFQKYIEGTINKEELEDLRSCAVSPDLKMLWHETLETYYTSIEIMVPAALKDRVTDLVEDVWQDFNKNMDRSVVPSHKKTYSIYKYVTAAVFVIMFFTVGYFVYFGPSDEERLTHNFGDEISDIQPGSNRATLSFGNGPTIVLNDQKSGVVVGDKGMSYDDGSDIVPASDLEWCTLSTPRGGQYQITLSDGTQVWLNSASTLRYPTRFNGQERYIEVEGEAYFDVQQINDKPFVVSTGNQKVRVLGTTFNINASLADGIIRTTLLTGKVMMSLGEESRQLSPGQQALIGASGTINVQRVNIDDVTAWKEGYFMFNNETLQNVMAKIGNWYDLDIEFLSPVLKNEKVYGTISRSENLSQVLTMLEKTGVANFILEKNILKVSAKK